VLLKIAVRDVRRVAVTGVAVKLTRGAAAVAFVVAGIVAMLMAYSY